VNLSSSFTEELKDDKKTVLLCT